MTSATQYQTKTLPIEAIVAKNGFNVAGRDEVDEELKELAQSIADVGIREPIRVRMDKSGKKGFIVSGHRRRLAIDLANETHNAGITEVQVLVDGKDGVDDLADLKDLLVSNDAKKLTALQKAEAVGRLLKAKMNCTEISKLTGWKNNMITYFKTIWEQPESLKALVADKTMSADLLNSTVVRLKKLQKEDHVSLEQAKELSPFKIVTSAHVIAGKDKKIKSTHIKRAIEAVIGSEEETDDTPAQSALEAVLVDIGKALNAKTHKDCKEILEAILADNSIE